MATQHSTRHGESLADRAAADPQVASWGRWPITAGLILAVLAMLVLLRLRGVWLDEIWTRWLTDPHQTLRQVAEHWAFEPHPPVYYFYIWSLRHAFDGSIVALRASNLPAIVPLAIAARDCRLRTGNAFFVYAYCIMVVLSMPIVVYLAELRAYYPMALLYAGCCWFWRPTGSTEEIASTNGRATA